MPFSGEASRGSGCTAERIGTAREDKRRTEGSTTQLSQVNGESSMPGQTNKEQETERLSLTLDVPSSSFVSSWSERGDWMNEKVHCPLHVIFNCYSRLQHPFYIESLIGNLTVSIRQKTCVTFTYFSLLSQAHARRISIQSILHLEEFASVFSSLSLERLLQTSISISSSKSTSYRYFRYG